ncbi:hypothetical protein OIU77_019438 [Salix suchowensis]|uniref:Uncharacterized protein n=1 Tax=Salix suchowensis TaxID=1278906 RepID=A0ABQ9CI55_9ROSI|nr:hypothetical protein OIU77_019438 [Salix suchowensis]
MGGEKINQRIDNPRPLSSNMPPPPAYQEKSQDTKLWGVVIFGLIGATATTYAVRQLRRTADELVDYCKFNQVSINVERRIWN